MTAVAISQDSSHRNIMRQIANLAPRNSYRANIFIGGIVVYTIIVKGAESMERRDESLQANATVIVEECIAVKLRLHDSVFSRFRK